jgi:hypothetical protein
LVIGDPIEPELIPRNRDGSEQAWARGAFSMVYHHPEDAHATPISNGVSLSFLQDYMETREDFFRDSTALDWRWEILPTLVAEGIA